MTIGAVIICKNEEALMRRCLDSLRGIDEIYISDTGSTDNTVKIAREYTKNVFDDFTWDDNFAKARNHVKKKAKTDWLLSIDMDEILHDVSKVREAVALAEQKGVLAVDCALVAEDNGQRNTYPRLFKNSPQVNWVGAIHNHLSVLGEKIGNVRITYGYSPAHLNDPNRAFRILKKEVETRPDAIREMFYLGREYWYKKDYENCVKTLGGYVQKSRFLAEKAEAFFIMAQAYFNMGMGDDARDACAQVMIINPTFKEAVLYMAKLAGDGSENERWQKNANQWKKMAETAENNDVLFIRDRKSV